MVDASRGAFVSQSYRYATADDTAIKALYPNAVPFEFDTQLSLASAESLADTILAALKNDAQEFDIVIEGVLQLEDFDGSPPRYTITSTRFDTGSRTFRLIGAEVDYLANATKLTVRG